MTGTERERSCLRNKPVIAIVIAFVILPGTGPWPDPRFTLSLDQSLLIAINDEARWMVINNLTAEKTVPDFRRFILTTSLEKTSPESVNIR